jgi:hypothetical protein
MPQQAQHGGAEQHVRYDHTRYSTETQFCDSILQSFIQQFVKLSGAMAVNTSQAMQASE